MCERIEVEKRELYALIEQQGILDEKTLEQSRRIDKLILLAYTKGKRFDKC